MLSKIFSQNQTQIRSLLTPDDTFAYLEYSSSDIEANGKTWKMFGSPVGSLTPPKIRFLKSQQGTPWFRGAFHYARGEQADGKIQSKSRMALVKTPLQKLLRAFPKALMSCKALPLTPTNRRQHFLRIQDYTRASTRDPR